MVIEEAVAESRPAFVWRLGPFLFIANICNAQQLFIGKLKKLILFMN